MISVDGAVEWLLFLSGPLFAVALPFAAKAYWRNKYNEREIWIFIGNSVYNRDQFQRAHIRTAIPFMLLFGVPFFLLGFFVALFDDEFANHELWLGTFNVAGLIVLLMLIFVLVSTTLYWSIMLYNRPKRLVPPDLREDLGILEERKMRRDQRTKASEKS